MAPSSPPLLRSRPPLHLPKKRRNQKFLLRRTRLSNNDVQQQRQMASLAEPRGCEKKMSRWILKHAPKRKSPRRRSRPLKRRKAILMQWISVLAKKSRSEALWSNPQCDSTTTSKLHTGADFDQEGYDANCMNV